MLEFVAQSATLDLEGTSPMRTAGLIPANSLMYLLEKLTLVLSESFLVLDFLSHFNRPTRSRATDSLNRS